MAEYQGDIDTQEPRHERQGRGCFFWGCLTAVILTLLIVVGVPLAGYLWVRGVVKNYTADAPAEIAVVELPEGQMEELTARFEAFEAAMKQEVAPPDLELTAEEINALINRDEDLKGHVFVRIEDGQVGGDVSIPADFAPGGGGRFFNASAKFDVSMEDGLLMVTLADATVNGNPLPAQFVQAIADQNLAKDAYKDKENAAVLRKFESLKVVGDKIILKARREAPADEPAAGPIEEDANPEIETIEEAAVPAEN